MAQTDREALVALYIATDGPNWENKTNWDTDADLSAWFGVTANDQGRVVELSLSGNNLRGPIPEALGNLSELKELWLSNNQLTGSIPKELGALSKLMKLYLNSNRLTRFWDHGSAIASNEELPKGRTGDGSFPKKLADLLSMLSRVERPVAVDTTPTFGYTPNLDIMDRITVPDHSDDDEVASPGLNRSEPASPFSSDDEAAVAESATLSYRKIVPDHSDDDEVASPGLNRNEPASPFSSDDEVAAESTTVTYRKFVSLSLSDNPWEEPPEALVKRGMAAASAYFADLFAEGAMLRRNMIKVVLVGQGGAGKTSLRQSMRTRQPTPTCGSEESTVQIDVEEMKMDADGVSLRVYDCAGQVAYTGLLQMFLSPRAVTLLVCNAGAFGQRDGSTDEDPLNQDLYKLQELRVCDWLRSLSFRIPESDVVVVATKCDLVGKTAAELAGRMERAIRKWLVNWSSSHMTAVRVEDGVSLTSCAATSVSAKDGDATLGTNKGPGDPMWACDWRNNLRHESPPSLLHRVMYSNTGDLRGATVTLPWSWNVALEVLEALGSGRDPVKSVHQMKFEADEREDRKAVPSTTAKQYEGVDGLTRAELCAKWTNVVDALNAEGVKVVNPDHALEGALSIREHEGSLVRHDTYVFLDVTWLARILKPLLNHSEIEDPLSGSISLGDTDITLDDDEHIAAWNKLKEDGILEPALARVLWPDGLSAYVLPTLDSLGLTHPLDGDPAEGLVVLLRLSEKRPVEVGEELDDFRRDHMAVLSVTWKIFLGVPPGAIEKVLMRCCSIGTLRTFWRFGVLVQGSFGATTTAGKTFALLVEYSHENTEIDMKVYGNIGTTAPWAALSVGISAVRAMCLEFPGLRWRAFLECPQHGREIQITKKATHPGDQLLHGKSCSLCSPETGGVGAAATDLLDMTDVHESKEIIFKKIERRFLKLQLQYAVLCPEASRALHPQQTQRRFDSWLSSMKEEIEDLVHGAKGSTDEVAKLQRSVGDLQHQLGRHQDVRGWIEAEFKPLADAIYADDGVMGKLDFVVAMLMADRSEEYDTPRQACVLPPWKFAQASGLSEKEQMPEGYDIQRHRTWFRKSVKVAAFALQVVSSTVAAMAMAPLAGGGAATVSATMGSLESMLQDQLERQILRDDNGATVDVGPKTTQLKGDAYASLRDFVQGVEKTAGLEIFVATRKAQRERRAPPSSSEFVFFSHKMAQVQRRDGDAVVQWVLKGQEEAWYNEMRSAPTA
eukprot:g15262.t1